jgi:CheY-like chemotaxis protein
MHFFWDIDLSNMSRLGVVRKIRGKDKHVIIIGQTADALAEDKQKALEAGCNDYIAKPIKTALLMEKMKQFDN